MRHSENKNKLKLGRWLSPAGPRFSPRPPETLMGSHQLRLSLCSGKLWARSELSRARCFWKVDGSRSTERPFHHKRPQRCHRLGFP